MSVPVLLLPDFCRCRCCCRSRCHFNNRFWRTTSCKGKYHFHAKYEHYMFCFHYLPSSPVWRPFYFIFYFYSSFYYPMYALKSQISVHKSIFREVFCHIYDKIPRHTSQNAITVGDLKCILAKCCERNEQQLNQAAITIFYSSLVRIWFISIFNYPKEIFFLQNSPAQEHQVRYDTSQKPWNHVS